MEVPISSYGNSDALCPLRGSFYTFSLFCQHQNENLTIFWGDYDNFMRKRHDVRASVGICCPGFNKRSKYSYSCILTGVSSGRGQSYASSGRVEASIFHSAVRRRHMRLGLSILFSAPCRILCLPYVMFRSIAKRCSNDTGEIFPPIRLKRRQRVSPDSARLI